MMSDSSPSLRQWLAAEGGAVPFRRFMEAALYDPGFGYYSRQIRTVGRGGDFATSATLSPALARAVAAWVEEEGCRNPEIRHVIEIGPGSGVLHRELRKTLGWRKRRHWRSHLVERSPALRTEQKRRLGWTLGRVSWHADPAAALDAAGGEALIFSNELVDAFPVTLLQRQDGCWQEVWLELQADGRLVETLRPAPDTGTMLKATDFQEGQRVEIHNAYRQWLRAWLPHWRRGSMLTIDYGDTADRLYHRRPQGSVRGFYRHARVEGLAVYRDPGHCDLTADVNFSDLMEWGARDGLTSGWLGSQSEFLHRYHAVRSSVDERLADAAGAGGAFQCLIQHRVSGDAGRGG